MKVSWLKCISQLKYPPMDGFCARWNILRNNKKCQDTNYSCKWKIHGKQLPPKKFQTWKLFIINFAWWLKISHSCRKGNTQDASYYLRMLKEGCFVVSWANGWLLIISKNLICGQEHCQTLTAFSNLLIINDRWFWNI